jgi:hypothetical protein
MKTKTIIIQKNEKQWQRVVMDYARLRGWTVRHFHDSRKQITNGQLVGDRDAADVPDLELVRPPRFVKVELKSNIGRIKPGQQRYMDLLRECGLEVYIWRPRDYDEMMKVLW